MSLRVIGAGLPRTGTTSLSLALEHLLGGRCNNMSAIEGHPFNLGEGWQQALSTGTTNWENVFEGYVAAVDWPASHFYKHLSEVYPDAPVVLSMRNSAQEWYESLSATILPVARMALADDWTDGRDLLTLFEQFTGTSDWDNPEVLKASYEKHNQAVLNSISKDRLLVWKASDGWEALCKALKVPVPDMPFPWANKREDWRN
jgi:hypothetical protein